MCDTELVEALAAAQHGIWSHWMEYQFSVCNTAVSYHYGTDRADRVCIPDEKAERWGRQMKTPYSGLTEKEKVSDRDQAYKVLEALDAAGFDVVKRSDGGKQGSIHIE